MQWVMKYYLIVDCEIADLHRHGDEVDSTVQLILFKFLLQIHKLFTTAENVPAV